ncbi:hypothetical protein BGZ68_005505 [Mortierella alpina]|nr:hypothetical protein BGZ68_005505 [Mortierella alpina]
MRFLTVAAVVSVVAVASAQTAKYPFKPDGPCVEACTLKAGKGLFPNYTHDENSPYWLESLGLDHDRSHPQYQKMMMDGGMCMGQCPLAEQELFRAQFQAKTEWYQKAKSGTGEPQPTGGNGGAATSSAAPARPTSAAPSGATAAPVASGAPSASAPAGGKPTEAPKSGAVSVASSMVGVAAAALLSAVALL